VGHHVEGRREKGCKGVRERPQQRGDARVMMVAREEIRFRARIADSLTASAARVAKL